MVTRSDILQRVAKRNPSLREEDLVVILQTFFSLIVNYLENGHRIEIRGFGSFSIRSYNLKDEDNRLPKNKYLKIYFRPSSALIDTLNKKKLNVLQQEKE